MERVKAAVKARVAEIVKAIVATTVTVSGGDSTLTASGGDSGVDRRDSESDSESKW